ncbi:hypothetical protein BDB01DRAFT_909196 [Pilobolus umbonatus]|nr:hypothetical protein BDB01DRAFT_909196 [Pilobolus umbonatus]
MDLKYILREPFMMDLKFLLSEPMSKQHSPMIDWSTDPIYPEQDYRMNANSPKSTCSSISTCSSTNTTPGLYSSGRSKSFSYSPLHGHPQRRRTASDATHTRHHMFIYNHPNTRPRSESTNNSSVQTRTPWTPFEDHLLQQGYDQGLSWAMISSTYLPRRSRGCCWGRFKTLQNKNMLDSSHSHVRPFRRPWKVIDYNNSKKFTL